MTADRSSKRRYTLVLEKPAADDRSAQRNSARYQQLLTHNAALRKQIEKWLEERGLQDQVWDISEPTAFNMLFLTTLGEVADQLVEAPGVETVSEEVEFEVDPAPGESTERAPEKDADQDNEAVE